MTKVLFADSEAMLQDHLRYDEVGIIVKGIVTNRYKDDRKVSHYSDFVEKYKNPNYFPSIYWLQKWSEKKTIQGKSIKDILAYKRTSLWHFLEYLVFYETKRPYERLYPSASRITYTIDWILSVLRAYGPTEVRVQNRKSYVYKLVCNICEKKGIRVISLEKGSEPIPIMERIQSIAFLARSFLQFRSFARWIIGKCVQNRKGPADVLLVSSERFCRSGIEDNTIYGRIAEELKRKKINFKLVEYDQVYYLKNLKRFIDHIKTNGLTFIGQYYDFGVLREAKKITNILHSVWRRVRTDSSFKRSLVYKGVDVYPFLEKRLRLIFLGLGWYVGDVLASTAAMIDQENARVAVIEHDENYMGKGVLTNVQSTQTISLQTELLYPNGCVSRHIKSKKSNKPMPTVKCVSGKYGRGVLVDYGNYDPKIIMITGHPGYDRVLQKLRGLKGLSKDSAKNGKRTVLFAGGGVKQDAEIIPELIAAVDRMDVRLVIKAHPVADRSLLKNIVEGTGSKNVQIVYEGDLHELIRKCDVFVSVMSTTVIDAMVLGKPVLLINVVICPMPYAEYGAAHAVYTVVDIEKGLLELFHNKQLKRSLAKGQDRFLRDYLYKLDGRSSVRVARVIEGLVKS